MSDPTPSSGNLTDVTEENFKQEAFGATTPVLVLFSATWCSWCKRYDPIVRDVAKDFTGRVKFLKVDIDSSKAIAAHYKVKGVPVVVMFNGNKEIGRNVGFVQKKPLATALESAIAKK